MLIPTGATLQLQTTCVRTWRRSLTFIVDQTTQFVFRLVQLSFVKGDSRRCLYHDLAQAVGATSPNFHTCSHMDTTIFRAVRVWLQGRLRGGYPPVIGATRPAALSPCNASGSVGAAPGEGIRRFPVQQCALRSLFGFVGGGLHGGCCG
jgi:hypothetical protein